MWSSPSSSDLFPRRPRRSAASSTPTARRSSATSLLEQRRRDLPPHSVPSGDLWAFDSSSSSGAFSSASRGATGFNDTVSSSSASYQSNAGPPGLQGQGKASNHGVIGSYSSGEATARLLWNRPEREEEEREEEALPSYLSYLQGPDASVPAPAASFGPVEATEDPMELRGKDLARALQDFIMVQMQGQGGGISSPSKAGGCSCERRVAELENQVQSLLDKKKEEEGAAETGSALGDRVSTLEGRQSAFQSQLAQISKVLGVPVGKHGKSSQLKTLVQTLHEEIDNKVQTAVAGVEAACVASATKQTEQLIAAASPSSPRAVESSPPSDSSAQQAASDDDALASSGLPLSTVLNALQEEHEASLTRLSTHFDERLRLEGSQRIALEGRVRARLGELEEWLQQVEGELGGSHFEPRAAASSITAMSEQLSTLQTQLSTLQTQLSTLESSWKQQRQEAEQLVAKGEKELPTIEQLQAQLEHQDGDVKALGERLAGVETAALTAREETRSVARTSQGLKLIVEKLVRDTGSAEELLQQYVSTITHQVARVTRQYVSVRIRDNNRLLDATLRARVPDYGANESESFLLEPKKEGDKLGTEVTERKGNFSFVRREDDDDGIVRLLRASQPTSTIGTTISSDASAVAAAAEVS